MISIDAMVNEILKSVEGKPASISELARALEVSSRALYNWRYGKRNPSQANLEVLQDLYRGERYLKDTGKRIGMNERGPKTRIFELRFGEDE